ncbi:MAG: hypothetical protein C0621_04255 [Desulfuromonas sp.]|nr:MAG: hypothetical protein C0621_04255 [Desulfuromonas sp.]
MTFKSFQYRIEYFFFLLLCTGVRLLPRRWSLILGRRLGDLIRLVQGKRRHQALENLEHAFPEKSTPEIQQLLIEHFRHLGMSGVEMLDLPRLRKLDTADRLIVAEGLENMLRTHELGKGSLILSAHLGFWEVGTFFLPRQGFHTVGVAKPVKNPHVDAYIQHQREAGGGDVISSRHAARRIVRALASGHHVLALIDQHTGRDQAVSVDFFGRPAYTTPVITQIAKKQQVPIIPIFIYRREDGRYDFKIEPHILLDDDLSQEAVVRDTAMLTARIETAIRRAPEQWFWVHRRWRD